MSAQKFGYMAVFTAAISLSMAGNAAAYNITIDQFYIEKNGGQYVDDTFSDNIVPPNGSRYLQHPGRLDRIRRAGSGQFNQRPQHNEPHQWQPPDIQPGPGKLEHQSD